VFCFNELNKMNPKQYYGRLDKSSHRVDNREYA